MVSISKINSIVMNGLEAILTEVEVGFSRGIPGITIVGLPDNAVNESKERIKFAIKNSGFEYPIGNKIRRIFAKKVLRWTCPLPWES
jgi:magnesium chelatase family protein